MRKYDNDGLVIEMIAPVGFAPVEWADDRVHAIDLDDHTTGPLWRTIPVCGSSEPGVSSDEAGPRATRTSLWVDCPGCIGILA